MFKRAKNFYEEWKHEVMAVSLIIAILGGIVLIIGIAPSNKNDSGTLFVDERGGIDESVSFTTDFDSEQWGAPDILKLERGTPYYTTQRTESYSCGTAEKPRTCTRTVTDYHYLRDAGVSIQVLVNGQIYDMEDKEAMSINIDGTITTVTLQIEVQTDHNRLIKLKIFYDVGNAESFEDPYYQAHLHLLVYGFSILAVAIGVILLLPLAKLFILMAYHWTDRECKKCGVENTWSSHYCLECGYNFARDWRDY